MAYEFQAFPSWRYHRGGAAVIVDSPDAEARLKEGDEANWSDTPAKFREQPAPAAAPAAEPEPAPAEAPAEEPAASDPGPETEDAPEAVAPAPTKKSRK